MTLSVSHIGVAGWSIPRASTGEFVSVGSHLERYASRLDAVEINSSFYRPHRRATYERWAAGVPDGFRFAVKLPKAITHERRLQDCGDLLQQFSGEIAGLGVKRGPVLVQLPPSLVFDEAVARHFFHEAGDVLGETLVCEPRNVSWLCKRADALLTGMRVARVATDPAIVPMAAEPGGWLGLAYFRLHGSPTTYWSDYPAEMIDAHAARVQRLRGDGRTVWTVFDNTAAGYAWANALALTELIGGAPG